MNPEDSNVGLLVMHYGTPATMEDILPYYTHIRRGRAPTPEQLEDLTARYAAIGGPSPLNEISYRQAELIRQGLHRRGIPARLYVGTKHAHPLIADAVEQMAADGIDRALGVVLAPHYSSFSVAAYKQYALGARDRVRPQMQLTVLDRWGEMPALIRALATRVREQLEGWRPEDTLVLFTAHSLPARIVAEDDPYERELLATSRLLAEAAGVPNWEFAYQSASDTGEPWLGPDVLDVMAQRAGQYRNVLACTVGFVSDHLEVLYDLGIEARQKAEELGVEFRLARTLNDDAEVMDALADRLASSARASER